MKADERKRAKLVAAITKAFPFGKERPSLRRNNWEQCCQMAKFDPFLSLDCARVEGGKSKERKGSNFAA